MGKVACFTGHRPNKLGGYNENNPTMLSIKRRLDNAITQAIKAGYTDFVSGMALGVDMIAAEIVLSKKKENGNIRLIAAIPFEGQEGKWPKPSQERWQRIVAQSDEIIYVCEPGYAAWKMQKRNMWMVDHSQAVIAVWDGTKGGTGNCVDYAEKAKHMPKIVHINPNRNGDPE
ncbi:SLOG family protein [Neobacillus mesonae]|uniref:DUF1273 domain-containing protein n=1 Tax=Neobacillus mesonae TaxID=1193713 RepID=A0A3Q9QT66_9BACI|nr:SLOG family protein [Neobacillus mesonae]AZU61053.1 hypothetical protein CHR53_07185 [Neobacillus mesonae]